MSFGNFKNNKNNTKTTNNISKTIFNETLSFIDDSWNKWNDDITSLKNDADSLQKMFNKYDKDPTFLQLREKILNDINVKKKYLIELEKLVLNVKSTIESSRDI